MTEIILKILDNVRYWDTCPDDYKKDIEDFLQAHSQALRIHDVVGRSEQLVAFLKWVGDGYDFENNAENIVKEYINEGN
jgi:hypothetical protein